MTARSTSRLVGVLAIVIVGLLGWLVISMRGRARESSPILETVSATSASAEAGDATLATPDENVPAPTERTRAIPTRSAAGDEGPTSAELAGALWVSGRVMFPAETPTDERAFVVAVGREFGSKKLHRVPVDAAGTFKVGFASNTKKASLRIDARYVYLEESKTLKLGEANTGVVLAPSLGGGLRGRVKLGASAQRFAAELAGATVSVWGWKEGLSSARTKSAKLDENLEFELGGLDPAIGWRVTCAVKGFAPASVESQSVSAGKFEPFELTLERGASVKGTVRDEHGAPVAGARLHTDALGNGLGRDILQDPVTDKDGRFEDRDLRAGEAHFLVEAQGFVMQTLEPLQLAAGEERAQVDVVLSRGLSIAGVARFSDGRAANEVTITVDPKEDPQLPYGIWFNREDPSTKTDAEGKFKITGLAAGKHLVSARSALKDAEKIPAGAKRAPRVRFEDRRDDVEAGTTDLVLTLESGVPISGRVVDDLGAPVAAYALIIKRRGTNPWETSGRREQLSKAKDGTFEIPGLADGEWEIEAKTKDGGASTAVVLKLPKEARVIELVVPRASKVRGIVLDPTGTPIAGASIRIDRDDDLYRYWSNENDAKKSDERGAFELTARPGSMHVTAVHSNWAPSEKQTVEVLPAASAGPLTLQLRLGGTITGRVLDRAGKPESGRTINAWGEGDAQNRTSDSEGRFRFERVAAGAVQVSIQPNDAELAATRDAQGQVDWQAAHPLNGNAHVTVVDGQVVDVTLGGIPKEALKVTGVVRAGSTLSGAKVQFYGPSNAKHGGDSRSVITDATGRYEVVLAQPGSYSVTLERGDATVSNFHVEIPAGPNFVFDIALPSGSIQGRVLDALGAPVADVNVSASAQKPGHSADGAHVYFANGKTKADGTFALTALSPATYDVSAQLQASFVGQTWQPSQARTRVRGVVLAEGASVDGIVLRFPISGSAKGVVRNAAGTPVGGAWVMARSIEPDADAQFSGVQSGADGSFVLEGLATGTYTLVAARQRDIGESETVVVNERATAEMNVTLGLGNTLLVLCEDSEGHVVKAHIDLRDARGRKCSFANFAAATEESSAPAPDEGRRFGPLPDGEYVLTAKAGAQDAVEQRVKVKDGVTRNVRIRLPE